jgi:hypothetical protein
MLKANFPDADKLETDKSLISLKKLFNLNDDFKKLKD